MYQNHWNLNDKPFENDFNTDFFVETREHKEVLNRIIFGVSEQKSLLLVASDHGLGKSYVARVASEKLQRSGTAVGLISHPIDDSTDFLRQVCHAFHVDARSHSRFELFENLRNYLEGVAVSGGRTALFIDNAETLNGIAAITELRKILDWTHPNGGHLLTVVLLAHPCFQDLLKHNEGLSQRIDVGARLEALNPEETKNYILQRLRVAKGPRHMFDNAAIDAVFASSRGIPRVINRVCDFALVIGTMQRSKKVTAPVVDEAVAEIRKLASLSRGIAATISRVPDAGMPSLSRSSRQASVETPTTSSEARVDRTAAPVAKTEERSPAPRGRSRRGSDDYEDSRGRRRTRRRGRENDRGDRNDSSSRGRRGRRDNKYEDRSDSNRSDSNRSRSSRRGKSEAEPLAFNRDEHLGIPSMDDLIRNDLKVQSAMGRRPAPVSKQKEEQDVVQYFGAVADDRPAAPAASDAAKTSSDKESSSSEEKSGRRSSSRRRGDRSDRGAKGDRRRRGDRKPSSERDSSEGNGRKRSRRSAEETPVVAKPTPTVQAQSNPSEEVEEISAFGDGLVVVDMEARKKAVEDHRARLAALREAQNDRAKRASDLRETAEKRRAALEAEDDGFGQGLVPESKESKEAKADDSKADAKAAAAAPKAEAKETVAKAEKDDSEDFEMPAPMEKQRTVAEFVGAALQDKKKSDEEAKSKDSSDDDGESEADKVEAPKKRRPGRPRKSAKARKSSDDEAASDDEESKAVRKPRRRRKKREEGSDDNEVTVVASDEDKS